jgi:hypothetical protein
MKRSVMRLLGLSWALLSLLLAGCASSYILDNTVQSFSGLTALPAQPTYRFERLPSQQAPAQAELEAMADPALHKAGLRRDDAKPHFSVQVTARIQPVLSPWASPWDVGWGFGGFHGRRHHGIGFGFGSRLSTMESPWYHREVGIIVRELPSNKVVFESSASNEGPWTNSPAVFPAMFEAALQGFPTPPAGPRQVNVQINPSS